MTKSFPRCSTLRARSATSLRSWLLSQTLPSVPVWVTENNVNADYALNNGLSNCNGTPFVLDPRGTSPFFAAWRSLVFELLGQAGAQALYHWDFSSNAQFGETDSSGNPYSQLLGRLLSFSLAAVAAWSGFTSNHFFGLLSLDRLIPAGCMGWTLIRWRYAIPTGRL